MQICCFISHEKGGDENMNSEKESSIDFCRGLFKWYDFGCDCTALFVGYPQSPFANGLKDCLDNISFESIEKVQDEGWVERHRGEYRYIISVEDVEKQENPASLLEAFRKLLAEDGCLLLCINNRLGLRYFCGDTDPYTKKAFDSVENYQHVYAEPSAKFRGRMYSRSEIRTMLEEAGWSNMRFYAVLPDLRNPFYLCAEDYCPREDLEGRIFPAYNTPETVFLEDEILYQSLLENGMFHEMANAYLVECPLSGNVSDVRQVTISANRSPENAFMTVLRRDIVEKCALYPVGKSRLEQMDNNIKELEKRSLKVVPGRLEGDRYIMPYIEAETGQAYLKRMYKKDIRLFMDALDKFRECVMKSSDIVSPDMGDGKGAIFKKGYVDLIPLNSFYIDGEFVFFDQEFCKDNYPANAVLVRTVFSFYSQHLELYRDFTDWEMISYFGLDKCLDLWKKYDSEFIHDLLQLDNADVKSKTERTPMSLNMNRQRLDVSAETYQRALADSILHGKSSVFPRLSAMSEIHRQFYMQQFFQYDKRKLILFGSGRYAEKFLDVYQDDYPVATVIDNQESRWCKTINGVEILSPYFLKGVPKEEYKILICIRDSSPVERQLESYGIYDYYVFHPGVVYPRARIQSRPQSALTEHIDQQVKKYHVGYIAGVFDLFHMGHLNLLRRAKEQCEYLIVGIVTDRGVREGKKVEPFIPFSERLEMVRSCQYVDEAHEIPFEHPDTDMAWKMYRFDVQFSGSDYEHDPVWLAKKKWLEERGSTMVFFPYTQSTSSTKLKKLITERLI